MSYGLPYTLAAIGDSHVLTYQFGEQVSDITDAVTQFSGTTATKTAYVEFRWSVDNTVWSSWLAFTTPMLNGLTLDPDHRFYIQLRATRTGSDNTGAIVWLYASYRLIQDEQAVKGHGVITQENLHGDTQEFFINLIQSWVWQVNGHDHYDVVYKPRDWQFSTVKPTIYLHSLTWLDSERNGCHFTRNAQISIGLKPVLGKTEGYNQQLSRLLAVFNDFQFGLRRWDFAFKGVNFVNKSIAEMGFRNVGTSGMLEFQDNQASQFYEEFIVSFSLEFEIERG